jgi:serine/threonine protein kinase
MNYPITFGKYLLLERINVGGMAEVFKSKAFGVEGFERILAIKRILPNMADDDEFINMFVDEARIAVQLSHANIVQIYELGKYESQYYIAMEYIAGKDLRQILDRYRKKKQLFNIPTAAFLTGKICEGLDYAHRKTDPTGRPMNVIHRDVSPQNILVSYEGAVKITDFGIAKAEDRASKTQAGVLKGKFGYMSPEQVRGLEIDHRSDIFAVGILLYEMVTGKRLFIGESDFSTLEKVRNAEVPSPREHNPDIPEELERIMLKSLAKERDERYAYASELHDDLQQFLIENNTIFNAKKLAALMKEEYQEDIDAEAAKMEEFMKVTAPPGMVEDSQPVSVPVGGGGGRRGSTSQPSQPSSGNTGQQDWKSGQIDNKAEKTMIFESGFSDLSNAPTQVGESLVPEKSQPQRPRTMTGQRSSTSSAQRRPSVSVITTSKRASASSMPKHMGALVLAGTALLSLIILLVVILTGGQDVGTLIVTSTPIDQVDVYLDRQLIGSKTPITLPDVPVGEHMLVARATGYTDKAYRFELISGAPAIVNIALEREEAPKPAVEAQLVVMSEPTGASLRLGGLPQGITPRTLKDQDPSKPIVLELAKDGYVTKVFSVTFDAADIAAKSKTVTLRLDPAPGGAPPVTGTGTPATRATLTVTSVPEGATVYLGRNKKGTTPTDIEGLDPNGKYDIEVTKTGYKRYTETVSMDGLTTRTVLAKLEAQGGGGGGGRASSGGGGGGSCNVSGSKLSVMAVGVADCKVMVGKTDLGVSPVVKKAAPVGNCSIKVTCPDGKRYESSKTLKNGAEEKVIIKPDMWK